VPLPLVALILAVFSLGTAESVIAGLLPFLAGDLDVSVASAGLLVSAYALTVVVAGPVVTLLTTRLPRRALLVGLTGCFAAGNVLAAIAPNYGVLMAARIVSALTHCTLFALALVVASSLVPPEKAGSAVAKVILGVNLATVVGVPLGIVVADAAGWRATFWLVAALSLVSTAVAVVTMRGDRGAAASSGNTASELRVLGNRRVQMALLLTALGMAGAFTAFTYLTPLLVSVTGLDGRAVGIVLLVFGVGSFLGGILGGRLADRAVLPGTVGTLGVLAVVLLLIAAAASLRWPTIGLVFVFGAVFFALNPLMGARIITLASGEAPTLAVAVGVSSVQVAIAFGGWFGGRVLDAGFGNRAVMVAGAAVTALGLAMSVWELRRSPASVDVGVGR
jgi:DHA1 family inner membrane transport protein